MEPIPETAAAISEYGPFTDDGDLQARLIEMGDQVRRIIPECIGLSLAWRQLGVTFTVVASDDLVAALDGLQYLDGGPCVAAVNEGRVVEFPDEDVMGEGAWQLFAQGTAAAAVASTLTLPIMIGTEAAGSINMYASSRDAFAGKHDQIAAIVGGWAPGAVANADLSFSTRRVAEDAPRLLFEEVRIQVAVGILIATWRTTPEHAHERLRQAAAKAGVSEVAMANTVIEQTSRDRSAVDETAEEQSARDESSDGDGLR